MKDNIAILAPGKGWGNFVSYISCFKIISEKRNKKITLITKKFSSAPSYRVGFQTTESIVTSDGDSTLLDPAQPTSPHIPSDLTHPDSTYYEQHP